MNKTVEQAIQELQAEIKADEAALRKKKDTVNTLCAVVGRPALYSTEKDAEMPVSGPIRPDQFYGQPLASSVRAILDMRRAANLGAGSVSEIFDALVLGGFKFDTKTEDIAKKSLRNSLAKNTALFHKLPNGRFGLTAWYPKVPRGQRNTDSSSDDEEMAGSTAMLEYHGNKEDKE